MNDQTISYYNRNAREFCMATKNNDMSYCRNKFIRLLDKDASILDVGCGSGRDAKAFLDAGYQVTAMDASVEICKEAETLLGQKVLCMTFEDINFKQKFDGVWACASLLHVSKVEIDVILNHLWYALKEQGILYASFKYGEHERVVNERFFNDYNEFTLQHLMRENRFDVEEIFITQDVRKDRFTEQWVNVLARKIDK